MFDFRFITGPAPGADPAGRPLQGAGPVASAETSASFVDALAALAAASTDTFDAAGQSLPSVDDGPSSENDAASDATAIDPSMAAALPAHGVGVKAGTLAFTMFDAGDSPDAASDASPASGPAPEADRAETPSSQPDDASAGTARPSAIAPPPEHSMPLPQPLRSHDTQSGDSDAAPGDGNISRRKRTPADGRAAASVSPTGASAAPGPLAGVPQPPPVRAAHLPVASGVAPASAQQTAPVVASPAPPAHITRDTRPPVLQPAAIVRATTPPPTPASAPTSPEASSATTPDALTTVANPALSPMPAAAPIPASSPRPTDASPATTPDALIPVQASALSSIPAPASNRAAAPRARHTDSLVPDLTVADQVPTPASSAPRDATPQLRGADLAGIVAVPTLQSSLQPDEATTVPAGWRSQNGAARAGMPLVQSTRIDTSSRPTELPATVAMPFTTTDVARAANARTIDSIVPEYEPTGRALSPAQLRVLAAVGLVAEQPPSAPAPVQPPVQAPLDSVTTRRIADVQSPVLHLFETGGATPASAAPDRDRSGLAAAHVLERLRVAIGTAEPVQLPSATASALTVAAALTSAVDETQRPPQLAVVAGPMAANGPSLADAMPAAPVEASASVSPLFAGGQVTGRHAPVPVSPTTTAFVSLANAGRQTDTLPAETTIQIVQSIRMQLLRDGGEAHIRLDPRQFGDMSVRIRVDQGQVSARVEADAPVVREWLQNNQHLLRQSLAGQHLTLDRLDVREPPATPDSSRREGAPDRERDSSQQQRPRRRRPDTGELFEVVA